MNSSTVINKLKHGSVTVSAIRRLFDLRVYAFGSSPVTAMLCIDSPVLTSPSLITFYKIVAPLLASVRVSYIFHFTYIWIISTSA